MKINIVLSVVFMLFGASVSVGETVLCESAEVKALRVRAEAGDAYAQNGLGWKLDIGDGVVENDAEAVRWYRKAAKQNLAIAQCNLGCAYANGEGVEEDPEEALRWWRMSAEQGCAPACYNLGEAYEQGRGVEQDLEIARKWYYKAKQGGILFAMFKWGFFLENAWGGMAVNLDHAVDSYRVAAKQGCALAKWRLEAFSYPPLAETVELPPFEGIDTTWENDTTAMCELGLRHARGWGVPKDLQRAEEFFRKAAERGNAVGQWLYSQHLAEQGQKEAYKWLAKAGAQGILDARFVFGTIAYREAGDMVLAHKVLLPVAEAGDPRAQMLLFELYAKEKDDNGKENPLCNSIEAIRWLRKAAEQDFLPNTSSPSPHFLLGVCFLEGHGVRQNREEARRWFRRGAKRGCKRCEKWLKGMFNETLTMGTPEKTK